MFNKHFRKAVLLVIACFVCIGVFVGISAATEKIYDIYSLEDLETFREYINCGKNEEPYKGETVKLHTDIDLSSETNWEPIGPIHSKVNKMFHGTFDGQGHVISNLTINDMHDDYYDHGLFGAINGATIKNLVLKNVHASTVGGSASSRTIGSLIGYMASSNVINCSVSGVVSADKHVEYVGGLIGRSQTNGDPLDWRVDNCSMSLEGDITSGGTDNSDSSVGGLIGACDSNYKGSVSNCFVKGNGHSVVGSDMTNNVGGLIGLSDIRVSNCFVLLDDGTVTGGGASWLGTAYVGGLIGITFNDVNNCFVSAKVISGKSVDYTGGLIGAKKGTGSVISYCYTTQGVSREGDNSHYLGGLVGRIYDYQVHHCVALNPSVKQYNADAIGRVFGDKGDADVFQNYGWNKMEVNDETVAGGSAENGYDVSSEDVWESLSFWQDVFGADNISYDGTKTWTIDKYHYDSNRPWGLPYLTRLGKPTDEQAKQIQYLNPYPIYVFINSVDDLKQFRDRVNSGGDEGGAIVTLNTSLDLKNEEWTPIGSLDYEFKGFFEGNGYTISNMTSYNGLFAVIHGAVVMNLNMKNVSVSGTHIVGGLVGEAELSTLLNCSVTGNVLGTEIEVGGLVGELDNSDICNCSAYCTVSGGGDDVGGLIGHFYNGNIDSCVAYGTVNSTGNWIGGLIGNGRDGNVNNCSAYGEINGVNGVGGLVGAMSYGSITRSFASGFIVGDGNALGGLVGGTGDELKIIKSLALNHYINGTPGIERISGGSLQTIENTFAWNNMTINGNLVHEGGLNGTNATSEDVWKNLTFWQSVFGENTISDDGSKMWNIITSEDPSMWCLPYLTSLGKPSDKDAENIQYLNPNTVIYPTNITYNDGQYAHKQTLNQNKPPHITLYKDIFDITKEEGSNQSFSLDTSAPWENSYLWQNNSHPITFAEVITDNVSWNALESVDAMKNQNITFALGDENQTSISGTERNVSVTIENYLQSYTNNSLDKTRTTDGWFFDTPYTVSLAVRPGPEAYHASEQNGTLWNSHVLIQNLTNNVGKQDSVAWRFATDAQHTMYNNYTVENQNYLNSTESLQVKSAESADGENVNITLTGYKLGDVNRNDVVNINDVSTMIKLILAASKDNNTYEAALKAFPNTRIEHLIYADDNKKGGDGLIDVSDLLVINDWLVNGSSHFNYDGWE